MTLVSRLKSYRLHWITDLKGASLPPDEKAIASVVILHWRQRRLERKDRRWRWPPSLESATCSGIEASVCGVRPSARSGGTDPPDPSAFLEAVGLLQQWPSRQRTQTQRWCWCCWMLPSSRPALSLPAQQSNCNHSQRKHLLAFLLWDHLRNLSPFYWK